MASREPAFDTSTSSAGSDTVLKAEAAVKTNSRRNSVSKDLSGKTNYTTEFNAPSMLSRRPSSGAKTPQKSNGSANGPAKSPANHKTSPGSSTPRTAGTPRVSASSMEPLSNELARLENEVGSRDVELAKCLEEIQGLRTSNVAKDKAAAKLMEDNDQLKEKASLLERHLEGKVLELKKTSDERSAAISSKNATEATLRRIYATQKDPSLPPLEQILAPLEADIRLKSKEIEKLLEDNKAAERNLRLKESALLDADKKVKEMEEECAAVEKLRNENQSLTKQLAVKEDEVIRLTKQSRDKSAEIARLTAEVEGLKEALTRAGETTNLLLEAKSSFAKLQKDYQLIELELARSKVSVNRVAVAAAAEWKDDNDKVIPVKQWVEERKYLQGEMRLLQEKLELALKTSRSEAQKKDRIQQRLKVIEEGLKATPQGKAVIRRLSAGPSSLPSPRTSLENGIPAQDSTSEDGGPFSESMDGEQDMVSGMLYDMLQKEVVQLRKAKADQEQVLQDKEDAIEMLTKRCETLSHAAEVDSKRTKREIAALEKEVAALKADINSKEKETKEKEELLKKEVFKLKAKLHAIQQGGGT